MTKTEQKSWQTLDLYLASFLNLSGVFPKLELNNGRVVFAFPVNDDLYRLIVNYNSNVNVPVTDFVTTVKTLRGQMLTMRGSR